MVVSYCLKENKSLTCVYIDVQAPKARDVVRCAECRKPRVVYSPSKTDREQVTIVKKNVFILVSSMEWIYIRTILYTC